MHNITMQDVRLAVGEGDLTPEDVLAGCNAELRRRAALGLDARTETQALRAEIARAREALHLCHERFVDYEKQHQAKATPDGYAKAARNRAMADMCAAALLPAQPDREVAA